MVIKISSIMNILLEHNMIFNNSGQGYLIIYLKTWDSNSTRHDIHIGAQHKKQLLNSLCNIKKIIKTRPRIVKT